jgi:hypothetical protein
LKHLPSECVAFCYGAEKQRAVLIFLFSYGVPDGVIFLIIEVPVLM